MVQYRPDQTPSSGSPTDDDAAHAARAARERRINELLSRIPGYNQGLEEALNARPKAPGAPAAESLTSTATDPGQQSELAFLEETIRGGGAATRRSVLAAYGDPTPGAYPARPRDEGSKLAAGYSGTMPWMEERIRELEKEIPEVPTRTSWLAKSWGAVTDIAGNPIGAALNALDAPAEGFERLIGMAYWNEIPVADRWQMAAVTYDSIWNDLFSGGEGGKREAIRDYHLGMELDDLTEKYHDAWGDGVGHFVLDPLNLIGGIGLVTKIPVIGKTGVARAIGNGLDFSKIPGVRNVPILGKIGQSPADEINQAAVAALHDARPVEAFANPQTKSGIARLFQLTPQAKADELTGHFMSVFARFSDPQLWARGGRDATELLDQMYRGMPTNPQALGTMFESSTPMKALRGLLQGNDALAQTWQRFDSLGEINGNAFWKGADEALATTRGGVDTTIHKLLSERVPLTPAEAQRYASYRQAKLVEEFMTKGVGAVHDALKLDTPDWIQRLDQASAGVKAAMAMLVLNNPRFAAVNYTNNMFSMLTKGQSWGDAGRFARRLLHPGRVDGPTQKLMDEFGFSADYLKAVSADTNFRKELLGVLEGDKQAGLFKRASTMFVELGSRFDTAGRHLATTTGMQRAAHAVWHYTGDKGGVLPNVPVNVKARFPEMEGAVQGLTYGSFDDLEELWEGVIKGLPPRPTAESMATSWAAKFEHPELMAQQLPNGMMDEVNGALEHAGALRSARNPDWAKELVTQLDDLEDELKLEVYRKLRADKFEPLDLASEPIRDRLIPWQDIALFERREAEKFEFVSRSAARHANLLGSPERAATMLGKLGALSEDYRRTVMDLMETTRAQGLDVMHANARRTWASTGGLRDSWVAAFDRYQRGARELFADSPTAQREIDDLLEMQFEGLKAQLAARGAAIGSSADEWAGVIRASHAEDAAMVDRMGTVAGLDVRRAFTQPEYLTSAGRAAAETELAQDYLGFVRSKLADLRPRPRENAALGRRTLPRDTDPPELRELHDWLFGPGGVREAMQQRNTVMQIAGRGHRDFVMLNYSRKYGIDSALNTLFPYQFFTTRTARDWARLSLYRPGATAGIARIYEMAAEINEEAGLPDRLKRTVRIPIPFLDDMIPGGSDGAVVFDPLRVLFPLAQFQDRQEQDSTGLTAAGQVVQYASQVGPAINPMLTTGLGALGVLGERDDWLRRGLASVQSLPLGIPGPRAIRAAHDWLGGISQDPDPTTLTDEVKTRIANQQPLEEDWLKTQLEGVWNLASTDGFEGYRVDRTIANMVGEDPDRWSPRAAMEALRYHKGELYTEAVKRARGDYGLRVLSGWMMMPFNVYPEGEQVQRGLDAMYREVQRSGDPKATKEFFDLHPEYRVKQLSVLDRGDPEGQVGEIDTELYYQDLGQVQARYNRPIEQIRGTIEEAERKGYLQTKEGRRLIEVMKSDLGAIVDQKEDEIAVLEGLYPYRRRTLSTKASPRERALYALREEYFGITRDQFKTAEEFYNAREAFIQRLPAHGIPHDEQLGLAVQSLAAWVDADEELATARGEAADAVKTRRDAKVETLTRTARGGISREQFQAYLNDGTRARTPDRIEYQSASQQLTEYFAIEKASSISPASAKALQKQFWQEHPLLQKYYGLDEPKPWSADSAAAFGAMDEIWKQYYEKENDEQAQRDYLASKLPVLNALRERVRLRPIQLLNWKPIEQLQPAATGVPTAASNAQALQR